MPGMDRKGPRGEGPRTGRGMGRCRPKAERESTDSSKIDEVPVDEAEAARLEVERDEAAAMEGGFGRGLRRRNRFRDGAGGGRGRGGGGRGRGGGGRGRGGGGRGLGRGRNRLD